MRFSAQISCIPGGVFLAETFANQRHAPSFQLTLQEREERWPVLRLAAYNGELSPAYWQTVNVALVVRICLSPCLKRLILL